MSEIYRFSDLELDSSRFQIRRNGEVLAVQPQVFDVLRYLIVNHDRVVSKDELLDTVWTGRFISEATLSSRIKAVRQLIGDTGKKQALLKTVRNRGFRYVGAVEAELTETRQITSSTVSRDSGSPTGIAILPFEMIGEPEDQSYIGEGVAADIISLLARHHWLKVMARGSSFVFNALHNTPQEIGAALGVAYVLSGRIRRLGKRIRIDTELADSQSGQLLWSQAYDLESTDLFTVQEEITAQIAAAIEPRLGQIERQRIGHKRTEHLDAWHCYHKAFWHLYRFTIEDLESAKNWFNKAIDIDADFAGGHAGLAYASVQLAFYGEPSRRNSELQSALAASQKAVALDPSDAFNRYTLGRTLCLMLKYSEAQTELEAAIEANQSFAQAYFALAFCLTVRDKPAEAIPLFEKAVRLSPHDPHIWTFHHMRGMAHFRLGQMGEAEIFLRAAVRQQTATYWPFATLAALLGDLARREEAQAIADRLLQMKPEYTLDFARQDFFFMTADEFVDRYLHGLEVAGVPQHQRR